MSPAVIAPPDVLVLTLPLPDSRNAGRRHSHWSTIYRRTQAYYAACNAVWAHGIASGEIVPPRAPWTALTATAAVYPWAESDEDNLLARLKPLKDWCVKRGIVVDDKPKHWHWAAIPTQHVQRKVDAYVVLTLTRCDTVHAKPARVTP